MDWSERKSQSESDRGSTTSILPALPSESGGQSMSPTCSEWLARRWRALRNCCIGRITRDTPESRRLESREVRQSVHLVLIASLVMIIAFIMVLVCGLSDFMSDLDLNFMGQPFPSGYNFFPEHIGELLQDPNTARSHIFFALCLVAGICLLTSRYPWKLKNVDVGDGALCSGCLPWLSLRQLAPPISLIFMACIPTSRLAVAGYTSTWG